MPTRTTERSTGNRRPVAVVMGLTVTGLAVARALGRRGIDVVATHSGSGPTARSRYLRAVQLPKPADESRLVSFYLELGQSLGSGAVLLPTGDRNVRLVSKYREQLSEHYRFFLCSADQLDVIASKRKFVAMAERLELPLPPTLLPDSRTDLRASMDRLRFPCVVKPEFTELWQTEQAHAAGFGGSKALPVETPDALLELYDRLAEVDPRLVVQQMIVGPDENHVSYQALVEPDGAIRAEFVARKLRLAPPHYGMGCFVESISEPQVRELSREILGKIDYRGMSGVQFKQDVRDGRFYLVEMGIRFNFYTGLAVACGVNFPSYCFSMCRGEDFSPAETYRVGEFWWNPLDDMRSMRTYVRDGTWTWSRWARSLARLPVNAYFSWDDPLPGLLVFSRIARAGLRRLLPSSRSG